MSSCATRTLYVGTRPVVEYTFRTVDGVLADPTLIEVTVEAPDDTTTTYTTTGLQFTQVSTGVWRFYFPAALDLAGDYWVYSVGSGGGADVSLEIKITIHGTRVARP